MNNHSSVMLSIGILLSAACAAQTQEPPTSGLPNPASVYCQEHGGRLDIRQDAEGNQQGICIFADGSECDEWAFFRGECGPKAP